MPNPMPYLSSRQTVARPWTLKKTNYAPLSPYIYRKRRTTPRPNMYSSRRRDRPSENPSRLKSYSGSNSPTSSPALPRQRSTPAAHSSSCQTNMGHLPNRGRHGALRSARIPPQPYASHEPLRADRRTSRRTKIVPNPPPHLLLALPVLAMVPSGPIMLGMCARTNQAPPTLNTDAIIPPSLPLTSMSIDLPHPLIRTPRGNCFLLVIADRFTKTHPHGPAHTDHRNSRGHAFVHHRVFVYGPQLPYSPTAVDNQTHAFSLKSAPSLVRGTFTPRRTALNGTDK